MTRHELRKAALAAVKEAYRVDDWTDYMPDAIVRIAEQYAADTAKERDALRAEGLSLLDERNQLRAALGVRDALCSLTCDALKDQLDEAKAQRDDPKTEHVERCNATWRYPNDGCMPAHRGETFRCDEDAGHADQHMHSGRATWSDRIPGAKPHQPEPAKDDPKLCETKVHMRCAVCGTDDPERLYYWLNGLDGPVVCRDHQPGGCYRNDHPYERAYRQPEMDAARAEAEKLRETIAELQRILVRVTP